MSGLTRAAQGSNRSFVSKATMASRRAKRVAGSAALLVGRDADEEEEAGQR